ncbi:hypothetical protein GCM10018783_18620 [Streptomyces griseosporeus]|nr:hypothetical protein GCM10018783_18620 [Streptomyces griseosporeus]
MHLLSDADGLLLLVGVSTAKVHDSEAWKPMVAGRKRDTALTSNPDVCTPTGPDDVPQPRKSLCGKRIGVRIARQDVEYSDSLGRRRRVIEHTISWLPGYRHLSPRYERRSPEPPGPSRLRRCHPLSKRLVGLTT